MAPGYNWRANGQFLTDPERRHLAIKYAKQQKANKTAKKARKRNRAR